jgi:hypothetical protein
VAPLRHLAYAVGWKKLEPLWDLLIRLRQVGRALPLLEKVLVLEKVLAGRGERSPEGEPSATRIEASDAVPG